MTSRGKKSIRLKKLAANVNSSLEAVAKISARIQDLADEVSKKAGLGFKHY